MKRLEPENWNRTYAAHLLVRAGFGATPEQIDAAARRPLSEVVSGVLETAPAASPPEWVKPGIENRPDFRDLPEPERRNARKKWREEQNRQHRKLVNWWVQRMISSPSPLQEKMTLFWHGHFATSFRKVRNAYAMYLQNQTFRTMGMGSYRKLVTAVAQDPAMLIYLDNTRSRAGAPNENFSRELMELFTLGEGHYSEQDIKEAARAFTGWMLAPGRYEFRDAVESGRHSLHDGEIKEFFGKRGNFDGHDIIRLILQQEQASRFIVTKLWRYFAYSNPEQEIVDALAKEFTAGNFDIASLLENIFTSKAFYSAQALRTQIKCPSQWFAGSCIALGIEQPDPRHGFNALRSLGQELFAPPNVKGWDGGYAWITTASLTQRYNLAGSLVYSRKGSPSSKGRLLVQPETILPMEQRGSAETALHYLEDRLYQTCLEGADHADLLAYLGGLPPPDRWTDAQIRTIFRTMMSTPQYQLT